MEFFMNIIIVDDDSLVAGALKTILEINEDINVAATGSDGLEACELYRKYQPDILLMDIRMKNMSGLEAATVILQEFPQANILLLTTFSDDEYIIKALRLGARGYLLKQDYASILPALRAQKSFPAFRNCFSHPRLSITAPMASTKENWKSSNALPMDTAIKKSPPNSF